MSIFGKIARLAYKMTPARKRALAKAIKASAAARRRVGSAVRKINSPLKAVRKRRLTKLRGRIKANQSKLRSLRTGNQSVIRLQRANGQGFMKGRIVPPKRIGTIAGKPFPVPDTQDINLLRKQVAAMKNNRGVTFERLNFDQSMNFGFKDMRQAKRYFTQGEIDWYKTRGFRLQKVDGVRINAVSRSQLVFTTTKQAQAASAEAARLAAKYNRLSRKARGR